MSINPYQPPPAVDDPGVDDAQFNSSGENCWRDVDQLVVSDQSLLPNHCLFCDRRTSQLVRHSLIAYPPTQFIYLCLFGVFVGLSMMATLFVWPHGLDPTFGYAAIILAVFASLAWCLKDHSRHPKLVRGFPVCGWHRMQRTLAVMKWTTLAVMFGLSWFDVIPDLIEQYYPYAIFVIIVFASSNIKATKHKSGRFWIQGCCEAFLKRLPELKKHSELP